MFIAIIGQHPLENVCDRERRVRKIRNSNDLDQIRTTREMHSTNEKLREADT